MSDGKPFWSSVPGVVVGVAGVVSAIVGLFGVSTQLGWIGGDGNGSASSSADGVTTTAPATVPGSPATSSQAGTRSGEFTVEPDSLTFEQLEAKEAVVSVENTGDVPLTMLAPALSGTNAASFDAADETCAGSRLEPGASCEITVAFTATQPGQYSAKLRVAASNANRVVEVVIKGDRGLLG